MHELWPHGEPKSSWCPFINRLLFIETRFLAPIRDSFFFPSRLPLVASGQDTGLRSLLPYESSSSTQLSRCRRVSVSWQLANLRRQPRAPPFLPAFPLPVREKRHTQWEEFIRDATEVKDCLEEKAEVKIKKRKVLAVSRQVLVPLRCKSKPSLPALWAPGGGRAHSDWF